MTVTIAKCESCGAALRIDTSVSTVDCDYCGVTSRVGSGRGDSPDAPRLRIDPPPPIDDGVAGLVFVAAMFGLLCVGLTVVAVVATSGWDTAIVLCVALLFGALTASFGFGVLGVKRGARELQWFRDNAIPGRANVERISAGEGTVATLGLLLEVTGQPEHRLDHRTTIPPLLIPRLTEGLALPVIVHPDDRDRIEVQWHLV